MSYSTGEFINDCEANANSYEVPEVDLTSIGCDIDQETGEAMDYELLRVLAERVARAMADRQRLLTALVALLAMLDGEKPLNTAAAYAAVAKATR